MDARIRRAASLVVTLEAGRYRVLNFVTRRAFACRSAALELLADLDDWTEPTTLADRFPHEARFAEKLARFVELGALVVEGTESAALDAAYRAQWEWGDIAGVFHFGIKDVPWSTDEEKVEWVEQRGEERPSPALHQTNEGLPVTPLPDVDDAPGIFATLRARRTRRDFAEGPISLEALTHVLHSGLRITGFVDDGPFGVLPRKMTPSGGARNPYEGYVLVRSVEELKPAVYHYSGVEHSLGLVREEEIPALSSLLAHLDWIDGAAAIVFLVANFPRTAWKYPHPAAYKIVLLEAGHIAQNMLVAATAFDLAATPIAALCDSTAQSMLKLDPVRQAVVHAVVLGCPSTA